jgi:hypothetical protein
LGKEEPMTIKRGDLIPDISSDAPLTEPTLFQAVYVTGFEVHADAEHVRLVGMEL